MAKKWPKPAENGYQVAKNGRKVTHLHVAHLVILERLNPSQSGQHNGQEVAKQGQKWLEKWPKTVKNGCELDKKRPKMTKNWTKPVKKR